MGKRKAYKIVLGVLIVIFSAILAGFIYYNLVMKKQSQDGILVKKLEVRFNNEWKG